MVSPRSALVAGLACAAFCGCTTDDDQLAVPTALGDDAITVASFDFPESVLLAELYSQVLEAHGLRVERAFALGPREFVGPALSTGLVELVPEYAGTALAFHSLGAVRASSDIDTTRRRLAGVLARSKVTALEPARAENANTFVVTRATAREHGLDRLSDLSGVASGLTFGGPAECRSRPLCLVGLREQYGVRFGEVLTLDAAGALTHQALRDGGVDVALLFTTDPQLGDYVELTDDKGWQPAENVVPLVRTEVVERWGPTAVEAIDSVSRELGTETLRRLNTADASQPGSDDVSAIAAAWLEAEGLS